MSYLFHRHMPLPDSRYKMYPYDVISIPNLDENDSSIIQIKKALICFEARNIISLKINNLFF